MNVKTLTATILRKMPGISKWQCHFLLLIFDLQLRLRGRHNFKNMSRQSSLNERTFHDNYARSFDFGRFNTLLCEQYCSDLKMVAFDPSYLTKSGKATPGIGYFWSGSAGASKWGLEIGGFACVDIMENRAYHLLAKQTIVAEEEKDFNLLDYYADLVISQKELILATSPYLGVDAFFSREPFITAVSLAGIHLITRMRKDAHLIYPYVGPHPKRRGAKTKYAGKLDPLHLNPAYFTCCIEDEEEGFRVYEGTLYCKALKRIIRVAIVYNYDKKGNFKSYQIYMSTDLTLTGIEIYCFYKARYQIEFIYRDGKQFVGLQHCQSRNKDKLHFHFNTALTTVSLAKVLHKENIEKEQTKPFSMADIKTQYINEQMFDLIINECGICPNKPNIIAAKHRFLNYAKISA